MGETRLESPPNIIKSEFSHQSSVCTVFVRSVFQCLYLQRIHSLYLHSITLSSTINESALSCCSIAELKSSSSHDVS